MSSTGLFSQGGYGGSSCSTPVHGTVAQQESAVNTATANVGKLAGVINGGQPILVSAIRRRLPERRDRLLQHLLVGQPGGRDNFLLDKAHRAVAPARKRAEREYGRRCRPDRPADDDQARS